MNRQASAEIIIRTDDVYEGTEIFSLNLSLASPQSGVFVIPNIANLTIIDTTSEQLLHLSTLKITVHYVITDLTIGFIGAPYRAIENTGPMIFTVGVIGDTTLGIDVVVSFSTVDGSTPGK